MGVAHACVRELSTRRQVLRVGGVILAPTSHSAVVSHSASGIGTDTDLHQRHSRWRRRASVGTVTPALHRAIARPHARMVGACVEVGDSNHLGHFDGVATGVRAGACPHDDVVHPIGERFDLQLCALTLTAAGIGELRVRKRINRVEMQGEIREYACAISSPQLDCGSRQCAATQSLR